MDENIGKPIPRVEDERLLAGLGKFSDNVSLPGQAHACIIRSPHAHARIRAIDTAAAQAMEGALAVLTGADYLADGLLPIPHNPIPSGSDDQPLTGPGGGGIFVGPHPPLVTDKARHAGEAVVMVVGETLALAKDAAERVHIDYEVLPAVTDTAAAAAPAAPVIWDEVPGNVCVDTHFGDIAAVDAAFAAAEHVVEAGFDIGRVTGVPMEPRSALGVFDAECGRYTLYVGSGGAVRHKRELATLLGEAEENIRVVICDVGGNFGTRNRLYPEFALVVWAARRIGRPVKLTCERSDAFVSDFQGRDLVTRVALALDRDGKFLAMRADNLSNVGARAVSFTPLYKGAQIVTGPYAVPHLALRARAVFSNTTPTNSYRSAGRPEVVFALERLIDTAARDCGFDPIELRRRNLIPPATMPHTNPMGMVYDSGTFEANMDKAMALADWDGFAARRAAARKRGRLRGLGLANYLETSSGAPRERAEIAVDPAGRIEVVVGTQDSGQGHETSFAQVAADWLGVPLECVRVIEGDTDVVSVGGGSHAGRSMRMAGTVIVMAADEVIARGARIAAHVLEAAVEDIEFNTTGDGGRFAIRGTDRALGIFEVAAAAVERSDLPEELQGALGADAENVMAVPVFPNGCHICEVEIDAETGALALARYTAVDDVGRAINPLIVHGQTHGGAAQGIGQALFEQCVHDDDGHALSGSFMDYCVPRADDLPSFATAIVEVHCAGNPLGVKAGGEGGTTPAPGVVVNAMVDALSGFGVRDVTMPATPYRLWQAINGK